MLIFEKGREGRGLSLVPDCDVPTVLPKEEDIREKTLHLPTLSETDISRHYTELEKKTYGVNDGFYPLGSCTMKYNPKINEVVASLPGFRDIHPLQPLHTISGCLCVFEKARDYLCEITGMNHMSFMPAAGAHGEYLGLLLMKAYHESRGDSGRNKIIIPDSAHGTNPASASMVGYTVISIPSTKEGMVDLSALKKAVGADPAGLMLTNPNTLGIFDTQILDITRIVHEAGGLTYYDGANLNAIMGRVRPGDMGFDVVHLNLHKTFSTPHGGGGPGSGAVGCKSFLQEFLPYETGQQASDASIGRIKAFDGNFLVVVRALTYLLMLGKEGVIEASTQAVVNANYMMARLREYYQMPFEGFCMHEFVMSLESLKKETGITAFDVAKALLDEGIHPPTMYFPLIVPEALMLEPTETEAKETLDLAVEKLILIYKAAGVNPKSLHEAPRTTCVGRLDEVGAARNPRLRYEWKEEADGN
ncbi:MAG: glycine dehydrogenase subunit 2 [Clostridiales bacterium]|nr:glycine dehydrogenase subunit 2 [Clostridiales bacterium]